MAKILIIEDEPSLQKTLSDKLKRVGFDIKSSLDGEEGYRLIETEKPDLVLLDLILPKLHGLKLLERIRANVGISQTRVLILTNLSDSESISVATSLGALGFLIKDSITLEEVVEKVQEALREK